MSSFQRLDSLKRPSLSSLAVDSLRKAIAEGKWRDALPSERHLGEMLNVSRPTVRAALHLLSREGLVKIHQGRRTRISRAAGPRKISQSRFVGLVTGVPVSEMSNIAYQGIIDMREHLANRGFTMDVLVCPSGKSPSQRRKLEEFVRNNRVFCCVLLSVSRELQAWFSTHSVPALVLGWCHPEVNLPSLDVDYRSVCRHANGVFLQHGHRSLALVIPNSGVAGDLASEQGFLEAIDARAAAAGARATVLRHDGTARSITARIDAQFALRQPPTAILVAKAQHALIVVFHLLRKGLRVPEDVSIIARDDDSLFDALSPQISHYRFGDDGIAQRLSRSMLQLVGQGYLPPHANLIFPEYAAGGTVRAAAAPS